MPEDLLLEREGAAAPRPQLRPCPSQPVWASAPGQTVPALGVGRGCGLGHSGQLPVGATGVGAEPGEGAAGLRGPVVLGVAVLPWPLEGKAK